MIAREVESQREHFDNLDIHIGYFYGDKEAPAHVSKYTPKFVAGARTHMPGSSLSITAREVAARQYSTLDLCGMDIFTLLVSRADPWRLKFEDLQPALSRRNIKAQLWVANVDFEFNVAKQKLLFETSGGLAAGGALLVRPDQHIFQCSSITTTSEELEAVILGHLGL
ncbi:hypothetical protein QQZ08_000618 [Neonectria magnoliae]|uniref:Uncharacterized protein n=1 Tax=Neonectria magnoliae TaxID=2732573 RepID=A0ABR1IGP0_9HYPO